MFAIITNWNLVHKDEGAWQAHHYLRHEVFADRVGYETLSAKNMEADTYDNMNADYSVVMHEGKAIACCRLIDCEFPILLRDIWPQLLGDFDSNQSGLIEATRIGAMKDLPADLRNAAFDLLISNILSYAAMRKKSGIIGIMQKALFKIALEKRGCVTTYLAPADTIAGRPTIAGCVDVKASIRARQNRVPDHITVKVGEDRIFSFINRADATAFLSAKGYDLNAGRSSAAKQCAVACE